MVHCEAFYNHMQKDQDFCRKNPDTVKRIMNHIKLRTILDSEAAKSEILKDSSQPFGSILSEGAGRPLHDLDETELNKAIALIVQRAEQREMNCDEKISVTSKEVAAIVRQVAPSKAKAAPKAKKYKIEALEDILQSAFTGGEIPNDAISSTIVKIDTLIRTLEAHKSALTQRQATLNARGANDTIPEQTQPEGAKA